MSEELDKLKKELRDSLGAEYRDTLKALEAIVKKQSEDFVREQKLTLELRDKIKNNSTPASNREKRNENLNEYREAILTGNTYDIQIRDILSAGAIIDGDGDPIGDTQAHVFSDFSLARNPTIAPIDTFNPLTAFGTTMVNGANVPYADVDVTGTIGWKAEGALPDTLDIKYRQQIAVLKELPAFVDVSVNVLNDMGLFEKWVIQTLNNEVSKLIGKAFFSGDGVQEMTGLDVYGTAFDPLGKESLLGEIVYTWDVATAAAVQVTELHKKEANVLFINPRDYRNAITNKDGTQNYVTRTSDGRLVGVNAVDNMRIIKTTHVAPNTMYVADSSVFKLHMDKSGTPLLKGFVDSNFKKQIMSIGIGARVENIVTLLERRGVVKVASISQAITDLTTLVARNSA